MNQEKKELVLYLQKFLSPSELEVVLEKVGTLTAISHSEGRKAIDEAWRTGLKEGDIRFTELVPTPSHGLLKESLKAAEAARDRLAGLIREWAEANPPNGICRDWDQVKRLTDAEEALRDAVKEVA